MNIPKSQSVEQALAGMAQGAPQPQAGDPLAVPLSDIPLPPAELVDQLDNSDSNKSEAARPVEVATLDFVGDEPPEFTHTLRYPFRWEGRRVDAVTVRQLSTAQVGAVYSRIRRERRDAELYDFYAEMTGLPAKVLRAIPAVDGEPIIDKAWDFLPPSVRPASD